MYSSAARRVLAGLALASLLVVFAPATARAVWVTRYLVLNGCDFVAAGNSMEYNQNGCQVEPLTPVSYICFRSVSSSSAIILIVFFPPMESATHSHSREGGNLFYRHLRYTLESCYSVFLKWGCV